DGREGGGPSARTRAGSGDGPRGNVQRDRCAGGLGAERPAASGTACVFVSALARQRKGAVEGALLFRSAHPRTGREGRPAAVPGCGGFLGGGAHGSRRDLRGLRASRAGGVYGGGAGGGLPL